jgi:hypothetical protein
MGLTASYKGNIPATEELPLSIYGRKIKSSEIIPIGFN